jgi:hypothetical protein
LPFGAARESHRFGPYCSGFYLERWVYPQLFHEWFPSGGVENEARITGVVQEVELKIVKIGQNTIMPEHNNARTQ